MAKFSVCRIYKVTLWLNFSYNYSVNLLQILHLYIHPILGGLLYLLTINEKFYKISLLSQILAMVFFLLSSDCYEGDSE